MRIKEFVFWEWNFENLWVEEEDKFIKEWEELGEREVREISGWGV